MLKNLEDKFNLYCNSKNLEINQNQIIIIRKLEDFYKKNFRPSFLNFFSKEDSKKGFYLHGGVGVGKTMILDFFFNQIKKKKKRLHFNEFMINFHNFRQDLTKFQINTINLFDALFIVKLSASSMKKVSDVLRNAYQCTNSQEAVSDFEKSQRGDLRY